MSEDKIREEFEVWHLARLGGDPDTCPHKEWEWEAWKACAAIKDAEIEIIKHQSAVWRCPQCPDTKLQEEIAAQARMIKELRESIDEFIRGKFGVEKATARIKMQEALAKSEHHNSRTLEKMLLEARIKGMRDSSIDSQREANKKLAELNKE